MPGRSRTRRARRVYEFIKAHRDEYDVLTMCRVLDVARAGYYAWLRDPLLDRAKEDHRLLHGSMGPQKPLKYKDYLGGGSVLFK